MANDKDIRRSNPLGDPTAIADSAPRPAGTVDGISAAEATPPGAPIDSSAAATIAPLSVSGAAGHAEDVRAELAVRGLTPVAGRPRVGRDAAGVIRSLDPDGFDPATRDAVRTFVDDLERDYPGASAVTKASIRAAGRAYGMVLRLADGVDRAGAVAGNGRLRSTVRALGEWEDRLRDALRLLPERSTTPADPQAALRAAVEAARARQ